MINMSYISPLVMLFFYFCADARFLSLFLYDSHAPVLTSFLLFVSCSFFSVSMFLFFTHLIHCALCCVVCETSESSSSSGGGGKRAGGSALLCSERQFEARWRYALPPRHAVSAAVAACSVKEGGGVGPLTYMYSRPFSSKRNKAHLNLACKTRGKSSSCRDLHISCGFPNLIDRCYCLHEQ